MQRRCQAIEGFGSFSFKRRMKGTVGLSIRSLTQAKEDSGHTGPTTISTKKGYQMNQYLPSQCTGSSGNTVLFASCWSNSCIEMLGYLDPIYSSIWDCWSLEEAHTYWKRHSSHHIQGFRTWLERVSATLGLEKKVEQGVAALCLILGVKQHCKLGALALRILLTSWQVIPFDLV